MGARRGAMHYHSRTTVPAFQIEREHATAYLHLSMRTGLRSVVVSLSTKINVHTYFAKLEVVFVLFVCLFYRAISALNLLFGPLYVSSSSSYS